MMKKLMPIFLAILLCFGIAGCNSNDQTKVNNSSSSNNSSFAMPDGYHEIIIGDLRTCIPDEWQFSENVAGKIDVFLCDGYNSDQASLHVFKINSDSYHENMTPTQVDNLFIESIEGNTDHDGRITMLDLNTDKEVWTKYYSVITPRDTDYGCFLFYQGKAYEYTSHIEQGLNVDDPVMLMMAFTEPITE